MSQLEREVRERIRAVNASIEEAASRKRKSESPDSDPGTIQEEEDNPRPMRDTGNRYLKKKYGTVT